ncbi:tRNA pseudouridine(38-40) synthase TruA [Antarcticibacterium flavum]|uniref:tRNA pseudouridine synthase A n=1 Tax=Antarcticibacterium flavum TaxID=2058175 RepID=A0A5B7WZV4_9FLAO|nr:MULTISPECIES: tRNA pseudouridine(38-40) synthase TruA [Antarcticibacterium]MCM4159852.1 tRNA pseudouridine(38-40) synthase TruA [Antarcticibacterium sp. W02-3]QCY68854.1 tRNA pseudouridine(38-40) synthase TruA [Antarcticibacterium flavum]
MRYFLELAYNGKAYNGWQYQPNAPTVQETLEQALFTILRKETPVVGAGRTDTGVHASQYFVHFDAEDIKDGKKFLYKLNGILPEDIAVYDVFEVKEDAHARFDARSRSYEYKISLRKDPFLVETTHHLKTVPDAEKMNIAASVLLEHRDFKCFSRSKTDVKTYNCHIKRALWKQEKDLLIFNITADRFLRNMVRAIVGTLLEVGLGKMEEGYIKQILESRDRSNAGPSVPAKGLFLTGIEYPRSIVKE